MLSRMSDDFRKEAAEDCPQAFGLKSVGNDISATFVLLRCAEEKLNHSKPLDQLMSPK